MDVIINANLSEIPNNAQALTTEGNYYLNWLACLGYDPLSPPLAEFLAQYYGYNGQNWLIAEPIHWEASHNNAMITAQGSELLYDEKEAESWFSNIDAFLKEDGLRAYYHSPSVWLIDASNKPSLTNYSPLHLMNRPLMPIMATLDSTAYWQRVLTELQMFLSNHPNNEKRKNELVINGLWLYGSGCFTIPTDTITLTDDKQLINCFPDSVKPLDLTKPINPNTIILINDKNTVDLAQLMENIGKHSVRCFWNNTAYLKIKKNWWNWLRRYNAN